MKDIRERIKDCIRSSFMKCEDTSKPMLDVIADAFESEGVMFPDDFEFTLDKIYLEFPKRETSSPYIPYTLNMKVRMPQKERTYSFHDSFDKEFFEKIGYEEKKYGHWIDGAFDNSKKCSTCGKYVTKIHIHNQPVFDYESCPHCRSINIKEEEK